jgi:hypothetical protein
MNYTFKNSSIVSVNSGTIVLNVSGKTRTFIDAKLVSAVNGEIVLDLPSFKLTKGAYVTIHLNFNPWPQRIFISNTDNEYYVTYHVTQFDGGIKFTGTWRSNCILRNATPEEIQELDDQLAAEGKCWNPDTMQIEKLRWKPKNGQTYYYAALATEPYISWHTWRDDDVDDTHYQLHNCFKTEEEARLFVECKD